MAQQLPPNTVEIPQEMLLRNPPANELPPIPVNASRNTPIKLRAMILDIFGNQIHELSTEDISSRAILASTVKQMMFVNNFIISALNGQEMEYFSLDELISENENDHQNYQVEYLNLECLLECLLIIFV